MVLNTVSSNPSLPHRQHTTDAKRVGVNMFELWILNETTNRYFQHYENFTSGREAKMFAKNWLTGNKMSSKQSKTS